MSLPQGLQLGACGVVKRPTAKRPAAVARRPLGLASGYGQGQEQQRDGATGGGDDESDFVPLPKKARGASLGAGAGHGAGHGNGNGNGRSAVASASKNARGDAPGGANEGSSGAAIAGVVSWLRSQSTDGQLVHVHRIPGRPPRTKRLQYIGQLSNTKLKQTLQARPLYTHQADAIDAVFEGDNVCIATGTASGKSRCFLVPCMEALKSEKDSRCLFIYPMKALAQDQRRATEELAHATVSKKIRVSTYDGDTPEADRPAIRKSARVVLTNPDMLHVAVLPNHRHWEKFFKNLLFVIIDEAHTYRGLFGSHMAMIVRRLRRICKHYGCFPQFILSSATIANPKPLCEQLIGLPVNVIDNDGSGSGERTICLWNPPLLDASGENTRRKSAAGEATVIFTELVTRKLKSICFVRARKTAEVVLQQSKQKLASNGHTDMHDKVMSYRAGYLPAERREIEEKLFSGNLVGVTATTALELGVDVGGLDATVHVGYPGSVASMWQQAGRAGRGGQPCLTVVIGMESGLDQYFMKHPEQFFCAKSEEVCIDPYNDAVLRPQLMAAAFELPLRMDAGDAEIFSDSLGRDGARQDAFQSAVEALAGSSGRGAAHAQLRNVMVDPKFEPVYEYVGQSLRPCADCNIRGSSYGKISIRNMADKKTVEEVDTLVATRSAHEGAVYMHQSSQYLVRRLDLERGEALAEPANKINYYTESKELTEILILEQLKMETVGATQVCQGKVRVAAKLAHDLPRHACVVWLVVQVVGYVKKQIFTDQVIGEHSLDLPETAFDTDALWFDLPEELVNKLNKMVGLHPMGCLSGVSNAIIATLPTLISCDRRDISSRAVLSQEDPPRVFIFDSVPGGGLVAKLASNIERVWRRAHGLITDCSCKAIDGCPACIKSHHGWGEGLNKDVALLILDGLCMAWAAATDDASNAQAST